MAEGRLWGRVEAGMVGCQAGKGPFWAWATGCEGGGGHPPPSLPPAFSLASPGSSRAECYALWVGMLQLLEDWGVGVTQRDHPGP